MAIRVWGSHAGRPERDSPVWPAANAEISTCLLQRCERNAQLLGCLRLHTHKRVAHTPHTHTHPHGLQVPSGNTQHAECPIWPYQASPHVSHLSTQYSTSTSHVPPITPPRFSTVSNPTPILHQPNRMHRPYSSPTRLHVTLMLHPPTFFTNPIACIV